MKWKELKKVLNVMTDERLEDDIHVFAEQSDVLLPIHSYSTNIYLQEDNQLAVPKLREGQYFLVNEYEF